MKQESSGMQGAYHFGPSYALGFDYCTSGYYFVAFSYFTSATARYYRFLTLL